MRFGVWFNKRALALKFRLEMMDALPVGPKEANTEQLARRLAIVRNGARWQDHPPHPEEAKSEGAVFLIGAGCSRSTHIPLASEIVRTLLPRLAGTLSAERDEPLFTSSDPKKALRWLQRRGLLSERPGATEDAWYGEIFERYYSSDAEQRPIIHEAVAQGEGRINWAHICLGELVDRHYVTTVLTTNFDQLALRGIVLTGRIPVVADGIEALPSLSSRPTTPQVAHLHGSMHAYSPRNSRFAMAAGGREFKMQGAFHSLFKDAPLLVVVGYAGGEDGIMAQLRQAKIAFPNLQIYWVMYDSSLSTLNSDVRAVLDGPNKFYIPGQDADQFFSRLCQELKVLPRWIENPLTPLDQRVANLCHNRNPELDIVVQGYRQKLRAYAATPAPGPPEAILAQEAARLSLAGRDRRAIKHIDGSSAALTPSVLRIRAWGLQRLGIAKGAPSALLRRAASQWEQYLQARPKDAEARSLLGDTYTSLAERYKNSTYWEKAIEAFERACEQIRPTAQGWCECRLGLAQAAVGTGTKGSSTKHLTRAILGLQELIDIGRFEPGSLKGAEIYDLMGTLFAMRADHEHNEKDYVAAVTSAAKAIEGVWALPTTSAAAGAHYHLAQGHREYGKWLVAQSRPAVGCEQLRLALSGFVQIEMAYGRDLEDAPKAELRGALQAVSDAVHETRRLLEECRN